ncbi:unnamed protein product, partial [Rotaria sordida]
IRLYKVENEKNNVRFLLRSILNQIMGPPKFYPRRGDITGVRAQDLQANDEFIIVEFEQVVYSEQIDIYETFNPGAVVKVLIRNGMFNNVE